MKPFKKGKLYRFSQPGNEDHFFYKNLKSAFDQTGNNACLPEGGRNYGYLSWFWFYWWRTLS